MTIRTVGMVVVSLTSFLAAAGEASDCPVPSVRQGDQCVLLGDAVLTRTIRVPSDIKLNCKGHRLRPDVAGVLDDPRTAANEFEAAQPALAMLLDGTTGAKDPELRHRGIRFRHLHPCDQGPGRPLRP